MYMIPMLYYADRRADMYMAMLLSDAVLSLDLEVRGTVDGTMGASGLSKTVSQSTLTRIANIYTVCKRSC